MPPFPNSENFFQKFFVFFIKYKKTITISITSIVICLTLTIFFTYLLINLFLPPLTPCTITPPIVKYAMHYHGISSAQSVNDYYFFYRNNKKCPLITQKIYISYKKSLD